MEHEAICSVCGHDETVCTIDELYRRAKELVGFKQTCSPALLQRDLKISYQKAVAMISMLEDAGLVGPTDGSAKSRKVLFNVN